MKTQKYCNKCAGDTDVGDVIHPLMEDERRIAIAPRNIRITNQNMRVVYCEKCKECGHSEYLYDSDIHSGGTKVHLTNHTKCSNI